MAFVFTYAKPGKKLKTIKIFTPFVSFEAYTGVETTSYIIGHVASLNVGLVLFDWPQFYQRHGCQTFSLAYFKTKMVLRLRYFSNFNS